MLVEFLFFFVVFLFTEFLKYDFKINRNQHSGSDGYD